MKKTTKYITTVALGVALYVALSMVAKIPIPVGHLALDLGYVVLAVYAYSVGPVAAAIVGGVGCVAVSMLSSGWFPIGWLLGNILIGILCGGDYRHGRTARNVFVSIYSVLLGILVVKTVVECSLYDIPYMVKIPKNLVAATMDAVVMSFGSAFAALIHPQIKKILR